MKKFILSIILLLTVVLFLAPKADAQTKEDCQKTRARASYNCLTEWTKCYYACVDRTKDVGACYKTCKQSEDACDKQVDADYKACLAAKQKTPEPKAPVVSETEEQLPSLKKEQQENQSEASEAKKEAPVQAETETSFWDATAGKLPLFIGDWYKTMLEGINMEKAILGFASFVSEEMVDMFGQAQDNNKRKAREYLETLSDDYIYSMTGLRKVQLINMQPSLSDDVVQKLVKDEEAVRKIMESALDKLATPGETIDVPGRDDIKVYPWGKSSAAVIESPNWENIKFREPVEVDGITSHVFELEQGAVEVKVKNDNPSENKFGVDAGWLGVTVSRTHFYVYRNPDGKSAAVIVYEGEVQVKTMGGKTIKVSPQNGEPGVVVVTKKLSPVKLAIGGILLIIVIGGVVFILRKKFGSKVVGKKKR